MTFMQAFRICLLATDDQTGEPTDIARCDMLRLTMKTATCSLPHSEQNCSRDCNPPQKLRYLCA